MIQVFGWPHILLGCVIAAVTDADTTGGRSIERVATAPQMCPGYLHGTRTCRLRRFPFAVVFRETVDVTQIVAEEMAANYDEDENLSTPSEDEPE